MFNYADPNSYTEEELNRALDKAKAEVFKARDAVFFGSIMCSMVFHWTRNVPSAETDGVELWWNPDFFMGMVPAARVTVLKHELWHVARLHGPRQQARMAKEWNWACDIRINNDLENDGNSFTGIENCWKDHTFDKQGAGLMAEEQIYELIMKNQQQVPQSGSWGGGDGHGDLVPQDPAKQQKVINAVVQAVQQAKYSGNPGAIPGGVEETLKHFLDPQVPWEVLLMQWFTDLLDHDYTWARPNRRYQHIYLPSRFTDDGRLEHLVYFLDVSGSITNKQILRFNSEVKYIQEVLRPQRLTLVQFDTKIQAVKEFKEDEPFDEIKIVGRGGTSLVCVRNYIEKHRPTAAVIFSDMEVTPMDPLSVDVPLIWAVYGNVKPSVPSGTVIHVK